MDAAEVRFAVDDAVEVVDGVERPAVATRGAFSEAFFRRMESALMLAPPLLAHLVELRGANQRSEVAVQTTRVARAPWNAHAVNDVNEQFAVLSRWVLHWADKMRVPPPVWPGWRNGQGGIVGLRADLTPGAAADMVRKLTEWLQLRLESICWLDVDEVEFFHDELKYLFAIDAKYPRRERARYSTIPCPTDLCGGQVALYPPRGFQDDALIICEGCARVYRPADWEHLTRVFTQQREEQAQAARAQRALARKYSAF